MKQNDIKELFAFIDSSPTCFHAVNNCCHMLKQNGFVPLSEKEMWRIKEKGSYYVSRNDSSLIAFRIPEAPKGFHIVAAHSDSPCFKVKELAELYTDETYLKWNVEKYGGMILSTWLDRPLSAAGRIIVRGQNGMETRLVQADCDLAVIPNVAIHMNRDMNKGMEYNPQTDMSPLVGESAQKDSYLSFLAHLTDVEEDDILGEDIFLYNRQNCTVFGMENNFIAGPRLDDLECVFAGCKAMCETTFSDYVDILAVFDNEEIGSGTKQGAASTFLKDVMERIRAGLSLTTEQYYSMLADSFVISADNAHALHPNHPEKSDPKNRPTLNGGIVIKHHGAQKYATDAYSAAVMKQICEKAQVPCQVFANRSDIVGGSTLGNILTAQLSVNTVDIGLPQLAMHSAYETAGTKDLSYLIRALMTFWSR